MTDVWLKTPATGHEGTLPLLLSGFPSQAPDTIGQRPDPPTMICLNTRPSSCVRKWRLSANQFWDDVRFRRRSRKWFVFLPTTEVWMWARKKSPSPVFFYPIPGLLLSPRRAEECQILGWIWKKKQNRTWFWVLRGGSTDVLSSKYLAISGGFVKCHKISEDDKHLLGNAVPEWKSR